MYYCADCVRMRMRFCISEAEEMCLVMICMCCINGAIARTSLECWLACAICFPCLPCSNQFIK